MDSNVDVASAGSYTCNFKVSGFGGELQAQNAASSVLKTVSIPPAYGWQRCTTVDTILTLPAGKQTYRLFISEGGFT